MDCEKGGFADLPKAQCFLIFSLQKLLRKWCLHPVNKTCRKMIRVRFSMSINWCSVPTKLASGCWTLHGEFSQKQSRLHQTGAQECEASLRRLKIIWGWLCLSDSVSLSSAADTWEAKSGKTYISEMPSPVPQILLESARLSQGRHKFHQGI